MLRRPEILCSLLLIALVSSNPFAVLSQKSTEEHIQDIKDKISSYENWDLLYELESNIRSLASNAPFPVLKEVRQELLENGLNEDQTLYIEAYFAFRIDSLELSKRKIAAVSKNAKIPYNLAIALRGGIHYQQELFLDSYRDYLSAQSAFSEIGNPHPVTNRNLYALALVTKKLDLYEEAQKYGHSALDMAESLGDESMTASCNNTLGSLNRLMQNYDSSISHYLASLAYARKNQDQDKARKFLNNLGLVLKDAGKFSAALMYFDSAEVIVEELNDKAALATVKSNKGATYHDSGLYKIAEEYYLEALNIKRSIGAKTSLITTLNDLAELRLINSSTPDIIELLNESELISRTYDRKNLLAQSLSLQSIYYEKSSEYGESLRTYKESQSIEEEIKSDQIYQAILSNQVRYETEKIEQEIKLLEAENEATQLQNKIVTYFIIGISCLAILILGFAFHFWRSRTRIQAAHSEIKLLYREMNHRVKNNLQLLADLFSLQSRQAEDEGAKEALLTGHARVKAMNVLHHTLDSKIDKRIVQLDTYLTDLVNNLQLAFNPEVKLYLDLEPIQVKIDKAIPLGLIVNEAVTNSFKYGMRPEGAELHVALVQADEHLNIKVQDNGPGFDKEQNRRSFGIRMMESMARQVKASLNFENSGGALLVLKMPLNED